MLNLKEGVEANNSSGKSKTSYGVLKTIILGIFSGAVLALAGFGSTIGVSVAGKIAGAAIFPIGLIIIVLVGAELFTGNCLLVIPLINRKVKVKGLFRNWLIVYLANFVGALIITLLLYWAGILSTDSISSTLKSTAEAKVSCGFLQLTIKGILCNLLVCIAVWMAFCADNTIGKIIACFCPVFLFVLCGFEHSIANMFYLPASFFANGAITWFDFLVVNLIPVTLGNIIGGCVFGAILAICAKRK